MTDKSEADKLIIKILNNSDRKKPKGGNTNSSHKLIKTIFSNSDKHKGGKID